MLVLILLFASCLSVTSVSSLCFLSFCHSIFFCLSLVFLSLHLFSVSFLSFCWYNVLCLSLVFVTLVSSVYILSFYITTFFFLSASCFSVPSFFSFFLSDHCLLSASCLCVILFSSVCLLSFCHNIFFSLLLVFVPTFCSVCLLSFCHFIIFFLSASCLCATITSFFSSCLCVTMFSSFCLSLSFHFPLSASCLSVASFCFATHSYAFCFDPTPCPSLCQGGLLRCLAWKVKWVLNTNN